MRYLITVLSILIIFSLSLSGFTWERGKSSLNDWSDCILSNCQPVKSSDNNYDIILDEPQFPHDENVELFFNFDIKNSGKLKDLSGNYNIIESFFIVSKDNAVYGDAALFRKYQHRINIHTPKNMLLGSTIDMGSFTIQFWYYPITLFDGTKIFSKIGYITKVKRNINFPNSSISGIEAVIFQQKLFFKFYNIFHDYNNVGYDAKITHTGLLRKRKWYHIALSFNAVSGKMVFYLNGEEQEVKYMTTTMKKGATVLIPHFAVLDPAKLIIGGSPFGYIDQFIIENKSENSFILNRYTKTPGVVMSPIIDTGFTGSKIRKFEVSSDTYSNTFIYFYIRNSNNYFEFNDTYPIWKRMDTFTEITNTGKYFQWKAFLETNTEGNSSPILNHIEINFDIDRPPAIPCGLLAISRENAVELSWKPNIEADLKGYIISYGTRSGEYNKSQEFGLTNRCLIKNLKNNVVYYFTIQSFDMAIPRHESGFSSEVSARPFYNEKEK